MEFRQAAAAGEVGGVGDAVLEDGVEEQPERNSVIARFSRNDRLADACYRWAFCSLSAAADARGDRARGPNANDEAKAWHKENQSEDGPPLDQLGPRDVFPHRGR
jgi:hypothetical protein